MAMISQRFSTMRRKTRVSLTSKGEITSGIVSAKESTVDSCELAISKHALRDPPLRRGIRGARGTVGRAGQGQRRRAVLVASLALGVVARLSRRRRIVGVYRRGRRRRADRRLAA